VELFDKIVFIDKNKGQKVMCVIRADATMFIYEGYSHPFGQFVAATEGDRKSHMWFWNMNFNSNGKLLENRKREEEDKQRGCF